MHFQQNHEQQGRFTYEAMNAQIIVRVTPVGEQHVIPYRCRLSKSQRPNNDTQSSV